VTFHVKHDLPVCEATPDVVGQDDEFHPGDDLLWDIFGDRYQLAVQYHEMLATRGVEWGLLGPRETNRLWCRHILNSVSIRNLLEPNESIVDVGSGAGLPGIPLALARPDLRVTLVDSLLRRTQFLESAIADLGIGDRVSVVRARAEEIDQTYDVVVARAVAPLTKLVPWCVGLMRMKLLALKGSNAEHEIEDATPMLRKLGLVATLKHCDTVPLCPVAVVVEVSRGSKSSTS